MSANTYRLYDAPKNLAVIRPPEIRVTLTKLSFYAQLRRRSLEYQAGIAYPVNDIRSKQIERDFERLRGIEARIQKVRSQDPYFRPMISTETFEFLLGNNFHFGKIS